jgi:hypothetical protein
MLIVHLLYVVERPLVTAGQVRARDDKARSKHGRRGDRFVARHRSNRDGNQRDEVDADGCPGRSNPTGECRERGEGEGGSEAAQGRDGRRPAV